MNKYITSLSVILGLSQLTGSAQTTLDEKIDAAIVFASSQLEQFHQNRSGISTEDKYTAYTDDEDGIWQDKALKDWCSGFPAGLMWMMYDITGESKFATYGKDWTDDMDVRVEDASNDDTSDNDLGFQFLCTYGYGLRHGLDALTNDEIDTYSQNLLDGSDAFTRHRYHETIGGYQAWYNTKTSVSNAISSPKLEQAETTPYQSSGFFEINIDMMMNIELPMFASELEGADSDWYDYALNHGDTTWEYMIRGTETNNPETGLDYEYDTFGGSIHVAGFDPTQDGGELEYTRTHQGAETWSTWSRGQGWTVYGYTMLTRYAIAAGDTTTAEEMLYRADAAFEYFMNAMAYQNANDGIDEGEYIAYSDFDMEAGVNESNHPRDTSASAIVTSAALELYSITDDTKYLTAAQNMLSDLTSAPYLAVDTGWQSILMDGSEKYDYKAQEGTIFGDFYFVESLLRYKELNLTGENRAPVADAGSDINVTDSDDNNSESVNLDASASSDSDGSIVSYEWTWNTGSANGESPEVSFPVGTTEVTLTVTDDEGATDTDTVSVTVNAYVEPGSEAWVDSDLYGTVYSYTGNVTDSNQWLWHWEAESFMYITEMETSGIWVWYSK